MPVLTENQYTHVGSLPAAQFFDNLLFKCYDNDKGNMSIFFINNDRIIIHPYICRSERSLDTYRFTISCFLTGIDNVYKHSIVTFEYKTTELIHMYTSQHIESVLPVMFKLVTVPNSPVTHLYFGISEVRTLYVTLSRLCEITQKSSTDSLKHQYELSKIII